VLKIIRLLYLILFVTVLYATPAYASTSIPFTINLSEAVNVTGTPPGSRTQVNVDSQR
jgi:hypothetical protein